MLMQSTPPLAQFDEKVANLRRDGYLIIENAISSAELEALNRELDPHFEAACFGTGAFYGPETKRFGRVPARSALAGELVLHQGVMDMVEEYLSPWCDCVQLNLTQAIEIHPGAPAQGPHRDQDMWPMANPGHERLINVMWALDDFTAFNGATRVWPESNRLHLDQPVLPEEMSIPVVMPKGSVCIMLGSTMHSGGANRSARPRRGLVLSYSLGWLKPTENPTLAYPPEVARAFPAELAALAGYRQHRPSLGNFEGQCPSALLRSDGVNQGQWVDSLAPEQAAMADWYREVQLNAAQAA